MKKIERFPPDSAPSSSRAPLSNRPPSSSAPPASPSSRPSRPSSWPGGQPDRDRILYVEDEDEAFRAAELRLKRSYNLMRAANDREACAMVIEHQDKLSAILMAIQLQGSALDGIQLTKLIRGKLSTSDLPPYAQAVPTLSVPIMFVTTYSARHAEPELIAAGGSRMITKPVDFVQLTSALTHLRLQRIMDLSSPWRDP